MLGESDSKGREMPDASMIASAVSSLKTASEIAKSLIGLRDTALLERKVAELNREILAAQQSALSANWTSSRCCRRYASLKKKLLALNSGMLRSRSTNSRMSTSVRRLTF